MLIGFSVKNYKSFNEVQSISFVASKIKRHKGHIAQVGNNKILKSGLVFGANAGGKSNLIKAVDFSKDIILNGLEKVDLNGKHFRIINKNYNIPGVFEYRILSGENEYSYGIVISYSKKNLISEWLFRLEKNGTETCIFNRNVDDNNKSSVETEMKFESKEEKLRMNIYLNDFGENISDSFRKKTVLSDIAVRSNEKQGVFSEILNVYNWFKNLIIIFPNSKYEGLDVAVSDDTKRQFLSDVINYFDTGIESIESQSREMDFDRILDKISNDDAEKIKIDILNALSEHPIMLKLGQQIYSLRKDENGNIISIKMLQNHGNLDDMFEYSDESDGTKRLFDLIPLFFENKRSSVILIDEIDRSLHTNLTREFYKLFYELSEDSNRQLIATTHDSNLLDLDLIRQDEIWFIERAKDNSSTIFSLNKFKERFDKKVDKEYLLGRYGAIPIFKDDFVLEELNDK